MRCGPRLPENAPFTPSQRAWLDGHIAGWFTSSGDRPQPETEEFPRHDPALPLEERLRLAEGRPRERVLMAAMAQLSSPKAFPGEVHLAVAAVRYERRARRRLGRGGKPDPGLRPAFAWLHLPTETDRPVIMIGTGTAPFRAFLQERRAMGARGRNWLFFGNPRRRCDFLWAASRVPAAASLRRNWLPPNSTGGPAHPSPRRAGPVL